MTLQGRGFAQKFLRKALRAGCTHVVVEVTSESTLNYRHWFLDLDGLIVTNIQREHLESHGGFDKYVAAKRAIVATLEHSPKRRRVLVSNEDVPETKKFLDATVSETIGFSRSELAELASDNHRVHFKYSDESFSFRLPAPSTQ